MSLTVLKIKNKNKNFLGAGVDSRKRIPGAGAASKQDGSETLALGFFHLVCRTLLGVLYLLDQEHLQLTFWHASCLFFIYTASLLTVL